MLKILWKAIGLAPVVLAAVSVLTNTVYADEVPVVQMAPELMTTVADPANLTLEPIERETEETNSLSQIISVSELSDIQPADWSFQALQFLTDRYNCLATYPNGIIHKNCATTISISTLGNW